MSDTFALRMQHTSLQFSDKAAQQTHDVHAIFEEGKDFPIKTGTEAFTGNGRNQNRPLLIEAAKEYGYIINFAGDSWVAVDRDIVSKGSAGKDDIFLISNDTQQVSRGTDRIMPTISFLHTTPGVGRIHVGGVHYPTHGAKPGDPNHAMNVKCAEKIAAWMSRVGKGSDLAFVNGDFNMQDRTLDFALGHNFTSMADELNAWQSTGHGPIDGMCSYDHDGRVKAKRWNVLDDKEFFLFSDHFMCRGVWEITLKKEVAHDHAH
jgi:hypothetical protein